MSKAKLAHPSTFTSLKIYNTTIVKAAQMDKNESNTPNFTVKRKGLSENVKMVSPPARYLLI